MIEIPYYTKLYAMNEKKYGANDGSHCVVCNKPVDTDKKTTYWVRIVGGGGWIGTHEEADANPEFDLGCYPVGSDCLKRHPEIQPYADKRVWGVSVRIYPVG